MPNTYFAANSKINGGALFASFNSKDGVVYFKLLKQIANNSDKKGNFDGKNPLNIKLSQDEIADIIRAVRTNSSSSFYHKFKDDVTTGSFKYYKIEAKDQRPERCGFGFTVKKNDVEIKVGFTLASAERLSLFLQNALTHIFDAEYSQDLKDAKEYKEKKATNQSPTDKTENDSSEPETSEVPEDADF